MSNTIVGSDELISFDYYMDRLFEISKDCNHENYLGEIIIPLLNSCCPEGIKLVPVYDDRATGRKTKNDTSIKKRMKKICAPYNGKYVVPDYIFVPQDYSFWNPLTPYLMVETKKPVIDESGIYSFDLPKQLSKNKEQLEAEIDAFGRGYVIFTDGITWTFLEIGEKGIIESEDYNTISLVNPHEQYDYVNTSVRPKWSKIKEFIYNLLVEIQSKGKSIP